MVRSRIFLSHYHERDEVSDLYWIDSAVIDAVKDQVTALEALRLFTELERLWPRPAAVGTRNLPKRVLPDPG